MAKERLSMRKIKEIMRLKLACGLSNRQIALSCHVARPTVAEYMMRAKAAGITEWKEVEGLSEEALENLLFVPGTPQEVLVRPLPDCAKVHEELRNKNVTLALLWQEYKEQHPEGYQYSRFVYLYHQYRKRLDLVMRQEHRAGEKLFVDYCDGLEVVDAATGAVRKTQLFVAVWGASNYTYAQASFSQDLSAWTGAHVRALAYFQCVPHVVVPDNLKSGVQSPCRYEPDLNPTYAELARHYGFAVIPARPRHPRDKAKVEAGVLVAQRWILAALRHRRFYTLAELNTAIRELLEKLNTRPLRKIEKSRRELFEQLDRAHALALPERAWEYAEWRKARVNVDYHIEVESHWYSVPCRLVHEGVDVRLTSEMVEVFFKGNRVASHLRSNEKYKHTTQSEHMPTAHRQYAQWTPSRILEWAGKAGVSVRELVQKILESRPHPEQGYRAALGILRLGRLYGADRMEKACLRALAYRTYSYKSVRSILARGLDHLPDPFQTQQSFLPRHDNIRGSDYYQ